MEQPITTRKHRRVSFKNSNFWSLSCKRMGTATMPLEPQNVNQSNELEVFYPVETSQSLSLDASQVDSTGKPSGVDAALLLPFDVYADIAMNKDLTRALEEDDRGEKINGEEEERVDGRMQLQNLSRSHDELTWTKEQRNLSIQRCVGSLFTQKHSSSEANCLNIRFLKGFLGGRVMSVLSREHKEKRKDMCRAQRAQVDAILSVAGVAAALAGFAATTTGGRMNDPSTTPTLSAAASLVASVCAEVATFVGAQRTRVNSVVESAISGCSLEDILTLTASAETCLRGAAVLQRRTHSRKCQLAIAQVSNQHLEDDDHVGSMINELALRRGADLAIRVHDGNPTQMRNVRVYKGHNRVVVELTKKCCGVFKTSKQFAIDNVYKDEEKGVLHLLKVNTKGDSIVIVFREKKQRDVWGHTITHLLDRNNHI